MSNKHNNKNTLQSAWQEFKDKPEYQTSACPFPPRRKSTFDKVHDRFIGIVMIVGFFWLGFKLLSALFS